MIFCVEPSPEAAVTLNRLAREELKHRILQDVRMDIEVCRLEGWDYRNYLLELKDLIDEIACSS